MPGRRRLPRCCQREDGCADVSDGGIDLRDVPVDHFGMFGVDGREGDQAEPGAEEPLDHVVVEVPRNARPLLDDGEPLVLSRELRHRSFPSSTVSVHERTPFSDAAEIGVLRVQCGPRPKGLAENCQGFCELHVLVETGVRSD